jgi:hypothetical protein
MRNNYFLAGSIDSEIHYRTVLLAKYLLQHDSIGHVYVIVPKFVPL